MSLVTTAHLRNALIILVGVLLCGAGSALAQADFTVTVVPKTEEHPYFGQGDPHGYAINGVEGLELTLVRGKSYEFQMAGVDVMHPFYISTSASGAGAGLWGDGVTGNFATGDAVLTFTVPQHAPDELWYQCAAHTFMGYRINIENAGGDTFSATIAGGREHPATATQAHGSLSATLEGSTLSVSGSFEGLLGDFTDAHLHLGYAGQAGEVAVGLVAELGEDNRSGSFPVEENTLELSEDHVSALLERRLYVNVHSTVHPAGEIRAQLLPDAATMFDAVLTGRAEIPANDSPGTGVLVAELEGDVLTVTGSFQNLGSDYDPAIGSHLHIGDLHENGPIDIALVASPSGDLRAAVFSADDNTFELTPEQVTRLTNGQWYVNVHTVAFPPGEIRGQMVPIGGQTFESRMMGAHETPPVETDASGASMLHLDGTSLRVGGTFAGLGSAYTSSHIHIGGVGESGGVIFPLTVDVSADGFGGIIPAQPNTFTLTDDQIDDLYNGDYYVNIHSVNHPPGEIRGQILVAANLAPNAPVITTPEDGATIIVEGNHDKTLFVEWDASDPNVNPLSFGWQLAADEEFDTVVLEEVGFPTSSTSLTFGQLDDVLNALGVGINESITLYHRAMASDGGFVTAGEVSSMILVRAAVDAEPGSQPLVFAVSGPAPNPTQSHAVLHVTLPDPAEVTLTLFDVLGRRVAQESFGLLGAGAAHQLQLRAGSLAAGAYVYRIEATTAGLVHTATGRLVRIP